ncbi:MAG: porin [Terriglobales bacterium]
MLSLPLFVHAQSVVPTAPGGTEPVSTVNASSAGTGSADTAEQAKPWWKTISFDAFASGAFTYNPNDPDSGKNQYRVFDFTANAPELDVVELVLQRPVAKRNDFGFRVDFAAGYSIPPVIASYGFFRNMQTGQAQHIDIPQLFASYIVPLGKGLRIDAGKFVTPMGYEVIEGYDSYNANYSHSFLFGYAMPFTNTGVKVSYAFDSKLSAMLMVANGWDTVDSVNTVRTLGGQFSYAPSAATNVSFNFIAGPEQRHDDNDWREVYEIVGTWKPRDRLTLGADGLFGREDNAIHLSSGQYQNAAWGGFAGYVRYAFPPRFALAFRAEAFDDSGGSRTGVSQVLKELTLTPEYKRDIPWSHLSRKLKFFDAACVVRSDIRADFSNQDVFQQEGHYRKLQFTTAVNVIYLF